MWPLANDSTPPNSVIQARREFAEKIRTLAGLKSDALARAFASVPREEFVGPGPWQILRPSAIVRGYETTPDADPRHLYENVLVALDASRGLNNGEPSGLARWLDSLDLAAGDRFLPVGCGVGYYTAIATEAIGSDGSAVGIEIDPELAARATHNLQGWPNVTVLAGDAGQLEGDAFDAIFVNAGATEPREAWLNALRAGGRLLFPLTVGIPSQNIGMGHMLLVTRGVGARFVSPVGIFHCAGARTDEGNELLDRSYKQGGFEEVRSMRLDAHHQESECWLHAPRFCLSRREVKQS